MSNPRDHSIETAQKIEKDCRCIAAYMQRRRASMKDIRLRNIKKQDGHSINELQHARDRALCSDAEKRIKKSMSRIYKRLQADVDEIRPSEIFSERANDVARAN